MTPVIVSQDELTATAIRVLCREIGLANTARFLGQFSTGSGDYTKERDELFGSMTMDEALTEIKRLREAPSSAAEKAPRMIRGLRTVLDHVTDLAAAKAWYARALERQPYFDQPFYVGFDVGGFELGLVPDGTPGPGGTVAYWGVPDAAAALERLLALGATEREPLQDVGEGIKTVAVADPFGNTLGLIENPRFSPARVE